MSEAKEAARRLVNYFEHLGDLESEEQSVDYDPADDARTVKEALDQL